MPKKDIFSIKTALKNIRSKKARDESIVDYTGKGEMDKSNADSWVSSKRKYLKRGYE